MKKLTLDLDELRVETFATAEDGRERGTVRGHVDSDCCTVSCDGTCGAYPDSNLRGALATTPPAICSRFCCV